MASFRALGIPEELVRVLAEADITDPTEIQTAVIADLLEGRDVLAQAPTGSGKTLAFGLPLLVTLRRGSPGRPRAMVLAPTRELAGQIKRDLQPAATVAGLTIVAIYGGVPMAPQIKAARTGFDVVVATPGRLADLVAQGEVSLSDVNHVVVDEADRMADMGFLPSVRDLLVLTRSDRQTVLFSATLGDVVAALTDEFQNDPVTHRVESSKPDMAKMSHRFVLTNANGKVQLAADVVRQHGSTLIFCRTRNGVDRVCRELKRTGVATGWIHGGRTQQQRDAALLAFADGRVEALVATDVAARGIHVDDVACVIHFDPPADADDYVHRSGRTARAGSVGSVVSFVNAQQRKAVRSMQQELRLNVGNFEQPGEPVEADGIAEPSLEGLTGKKSKKRRGSSRTGKARPKNKKRSLKNKGKRRATRR